MKTYDLFDLVSIQLLPDMPETGKMVLISALNEVLEFMSDDISEHEFICWLDNLKSILVECQEISQDLLAGR